MCFFCKFNLLVTFLFDYDWCVLSYFCIVWTYIDENEGMLRVHVWSLF